MKNVGLLGFVFLEFLNTGLASESYMESKFTTNHEEF